VLEPLDRERHLGGHGLPQELLKLRHLLVRVIPHRIRPIHLPERDRDVHAPFSFLTKRPAVPVEPLWLYLTPDGLLR
jgi:hypothetical protein